MQTAVRRPPGIYSLISYIPKQNRWEQGVNGSGSINIRDDAVRHKLFVRFPVLTVSARSGQHRERNRGKMCLLDFTHLVITELPMNEQHEEVDGVEICNWRVETGGKRPRQTH